MENTPTARQRQRRCRTDLDRNPNDNDFYLLDRENDVKWTPERIEKIREIYQPGGSRYNKSIPTHPRLVILSLLNTLEAQQTEQETMLQHVENVWRLARTHVRKCQSYGPLLVSQEESDQASLDAIEQFIRTRQE